MKTYNENKHYGSLSKIARQHKVEYPMLYYRVVVRKWPLEKALKTPVRSTSNRRNDLDIGLEVMLSMRNKGQQFSLLDIAEVCGVTHQHIGQIARKALRKVNNKLRLSMGMSWRQWIENGRREMSISL